MQLCGTDEYTKTLMNRIATGEATEAERAEFNTHISNMQDAHAPPLPPRPSSQWHELSVAADKGKQPEAQPGAEASATNEADNEEAKLQSMLADFWGNKKRLGEFRKNLKDTKLGKEDLAAVKAKGPKKSKPVMETRKMAKYKTINQFYPPMDYPRQVLAAKEKEALKFGTPESTWPKKHNPILYLTEYDCTPAENQLVAQMYKVDQMKQNTEHAEPSAPSTKANEVQNDSKQTDEPTPKKPKAKDESKRFPKATGHAASAYTKPFCDFLQDNPTVFHAVGSTKQMLKDAGWTELDEREAWDIKPSGKYVVERNGSSMIAFVVGEHYKPGNGAAIVAGHVDAITAKLKPVSEKQNKAGYVQLGVAPYAGGLNETWWDRDLGIGGRVLVREGDKVVSKLVKLDYPIARIPTLAPHFGAAASPPFNKETQMVPIIGLDSTDSSATQVQTSDGFSEPPILGGEKTPASSFVTKQPPALVKAIGDAIGLTTDTYSKIVNWELELFDLQPATVGGLNKEFIFGGRIDDKLCSWAAMQAMLISQQYDTRFSSIIKVVGWFDNEEIGSQLRQGARSNFLPQTLERAVGSLADHHPTSDLMGRTYANSFLLSADVTHAVNPNFLDAYLGLHAPHLNVGLAVAADPNGHMATDAVSTSILQRCQDRIGAKLQVFQIRNDSRSGGTIGPMLSSMTGIRAIDAGMPQLSMHSIRATTGALDPGLGVFAFIGFLNGFERAEKEMRG